VIHFHENVSGSWDIFQPILVKASEDVDGKWDNNLFKLSSDVSADSWKVEAVEKVGLERNGLTPEDNKNENPII